MNDYYDADLIAAMTKVITHAREDFYVFRHVDAPIPPLRYPNTIHRVSRAVPEHRLFLVDVWEYPLIRQLAA